MISPAPSDVAALLEFVLSVNPPNSVTSMYLFGGHRDDRAHRESDIDLGVLLRRDAYPTARDRFEEGLRLASWIAAETRCPLVDLVVLNDAPPGLAARIVTSGSAIYCADAELDHAFRRDAQLRAIDLEPFLRRARRLKLRAIAR
ncbi:MAG: nucleotidyltransferase domain-containing protein [Gemmatimonadaceae bacterium]